MLTNRVLSLLENVAANEAGIKVSDLANLYAVSPRVIYYDIDEILYFIRREKLPLAVAVENGLVRCTCEGDPACAQELLGQALAEHAERVILTPEERLMEILFHLLSGAPVRIATMMHELDVSKSTVVNDMDAIKHFFKGYGVTASASAAKGFCLTGPETEVRLAACRYLLALLGPNNVAGRIHIEPAIWERRPYRYYLSRPLFHALENAAKEPLQATELSYRLMDGCICAAMVSLARDETNLQTLAAAQRAMLRETEVLRAARRITEGLCLAVRLRHPQNLTDLLALSMLCPGPDYRRALYLNQSVDLRVLAANFAAEVCARIKAPVGQALLHDIKNELFQLLTRTDAPLQVWDDHIVLSLRREYDGLYRIVQESSGMVATAFGRALTEQQLVYLMLNFIELYERHASGEKAPDVLVVCNSGTVVSRLMSNKLQLFLDINIVDVISAYETAEYLSEHTVDCIVSTVPVLSGQTQCIMVNPLLTEADLKALWEVFPPRRANFQGEKTAVSAGALVNRLLYLNEVSSALDVPPSAQAAQGESLAGLVAKECICLDSACTTLAQAVRVSGQLLERQGFIDAAYTEEIVRAVRENGRFMLIGPSIIMPHSMAGRHVNRTGIAVLRLTHPVRLEDADIQVKWIFTLCTVDRMSHLTALAQLAQRIGDPAALRHMEEARTPAQLRRLLQEPQELNLKDRNDDDA